MQPEDWTGRLGGEAPDRCIEILTEVVSAVDAVNKQDWYPYLNWFRDGVRPPPSLGWDRELHRLISTHRLPG